MNSERPNLLLVKAITACFINRALPEPNGKIDIVVDKMLSNIKMPADTMGDGSEGEIANALRNTLDWLRTLPSDIRVDSKDLLERVRVNCSFNSDYIDGLDRVLKLEAEDYLNAERVKTIVSEINYAMRHTAFSQLWRESNKKVNFSGDRISIREFIKDFKEELQEFENEGAEDQEKAGFGGSLSTENLQSVIEVMRRTKELASSEGRLKTGLRGLNRLLGGEGYARGEQFNYGALTHNYKTGILLDHCRWFCRHNVPYLFDKNKKPLILRVSFENKLEQDLPAIYKSLWEAEHQQKYNRQDIDPDEAARYVIERLTVNGYHFEMRCYDPNDFDVWDLIDILNMYEAKGYEIAAVIVDYPELITKKGGKSNARQDEKIVYTFEVLRNHCFPRNITQITAHQLSTEAQKLAREGTANFASKVATGSYYMNCQSLSTKLDGECILHIHKIGEESFLTFARGKHRGGEETPIKHRSFAYRFEKYGGIVDDIDTEEDRALYSFAGIDGGGTVDNTSTHNGMTTDNDW